MTADRLTRVAIYRDHLGFKCPGCGAVVGLDEANCIGRHPVDPAVARNVYEVEAQNLAQVQFEIRFECQFGGAEVRDPVVR